MKNLVVCIVVSFLISVTCFGNTNQDSVAVLRHSIPDFRGVSSWTQMAGLTLFSPDGKYLAVSSKGGDVAIFEAGTGKLISKLDGSRFICFSFSPDSKHAVGQSGLDFSTHVFEVESGKTVRVINGLSGLGKTTKIFGVGIFGEVPGYFPFIVPEMGRVPVTKNWKHLLVNRNDKEFSIVDFETGEQKFDLQHANFNAGWQTAKLAFAFMGAFYGNPVGLLFLGSTSNPQFSGNSKYLLIANGNKKPTLWDLEGGQLISKFDAGERVLHSKFSPDETMVATSDFKGITKVWETRTGHLISTIGSEKERGAVAGWNKDGNKIFINPFRKGDLRAYDPKSGTLLYRFENSAPTGSIFSNASRLLVTAPRKNKAVLLHIWDVESGKLLAAIPRSKGQDSLVAVKWSPGDEMLVTSTGLKKEIQIWNIKGELLGTLSSSTLPMQFSADGRYLATGGKGTSGNVDTAYLWEFREKLGNDNSSAPTDGLK